MSDRNGPGAMDLPDADYFFYELDATPASEYRLLLLALASSLLVHCILILVPIAPADQTRVKRAISVDISLGPEKHQGQATVDKDASAERPTTTTSIPHSPSKPKPKPTLDAADVPLEPQRDSDSAPKKKADTSPRAPQREREYSASRSGGTIFDPKLRQELENLRSQPNFHVRQPKIQTHHDIHGGTVLRVGDNCMQQVAGVDSMDPDRWTLPSKCAGSKSNSEKMADRLRQALQ